MFLRNIFTVFLFIFFLNNILFGAIYKSKGHYYSDYYKDIKILKHKVQKNPSDLINLERLIKLLYSMEEFTGVIDFSEMYLNKQKNYEISYIKIISLASVGDYKSAGANLEKFLLDYEHSDRERNILNEKLELFKRSRDFKSEPGNVNPVGGFGNINIISFNNRGKYLIGYDKKNNRIGAYSPQGINKQGGKSILFLDEFQDDLIFISFSPDGKEALATVENNGEVKILYNRKNHFEALWGTWVLIKELNPGKVNSFANFLPDGNRVIFSSNVDSESGFDIYLVDRTDVDSAWKQPQKLKGINTSLDESSVFVHPDGETIYFSSNGIEGFGGYDLFYGKLIYNKKNIEVKEIKNLNDVNTFRNEVIPPVIDYNIENVFYIFQKAGNLKVYKANEKKDKYLPCAVSFYDIFVYDKKTSKPIKANIKLIGKTSSNNSILYTKNSDDDGFAGFTLQRNQSYFLTINSPDYVYSNYKINIDLTKDHITEKFYLEKGKVKIGFSYVAENIYFDTNSDKIKSASFSGLENLYDFLYKNPGIKVNISGYTDNIGKYKYNIKLSQRRARAIARYLISKGIPGDRINTAGFGYKKNIATNKTETGRQKNRRVEILVISSD